MRLRPVELGDAAFLYRLLEERPSEANVTHSRMPTIEEHGNFILTAPYAAWYVIETDHGDAGAVYLTLSDEVGVAVLLSHQRLGLASSAITELMVLNPRPTYRAHVAPGNMASHSLFSGLGFLASHTVYVLRK